MQEKSFATCFDKNCEEFAELLMTLVSENPSICNINQKKEVFKKDRAITSNEYVLAIGPDGSKVNRASFPDSYNKYGIHIGYRGRKAWISCENFDWTEKSLGEFHTDLILLLKELGMSTDNIDDRIAENVKKVKTEKSMDGISSISTIDGIIMSSLTTILGVIPMAIAHGEGSEVYAPLGQVIMGGLTTSTFITLIIMPIFYYRSERRRMNRKYNRRKGI